MRTVVRLEGQRQQRLRQRLVGEKGCNSSCVSEGKDTFSSCWGNRSISIAAPDAGRMTVKRLLFTKVQPTIVITAVLQRNKQPRIAAFRRLRLVRACVRGDGRNTLISHWRRDMPTPLEIVRATYEGSSEENGRNLLAALAPMPSGPRPPVPLRRYLYRPGKYHQECASAPGQRMARLPRRCRPLYDAGDNVIAQGFITAPTGPPANPSAPLLRIFIRCAPAKS